MKITKFVHSCLLVETTQQTVLIDPGTYSYQSHLLRLPELRGLDYIVITHEHPDHYSPEFLAAICAKFPHAVILTNDDLAGQIKKQKLPNKISTGSQDNIEIFQTDHEKLAWGLPSAINIGVHIDGKFTDPGDSLHPKATREILALPLTAPFASVKQSLEAVVKLKPKKVIPLHDWPWHKSARDEYYARSKDYLGSKGIEFISLENAEPVEL